MADAAAPAKNRDVIAFISFAFMEVGYHESNLLKPESG